jgi:hypothetical protein
MGATAPGARSEGTMSGADGSTATAPPPSAADGSHRPGAGAERSDDDGQDGGSDPATPTSAPGISVEQIVTAAVRVRISTIAGLQGIEEARLRRSGSDFVLQYQCEDPPGGDEGVCPCTELQKQVPSAQVADLVQTVTAPRRVLADGSPVDLELTLQDRSTRHLSTMVGGKLLPEVFDIDCR